MNWLVHIVAGYFATAAFIPNAKELFLPIIIFSVIVDADHFIPFIKIFLKKERKFWNYYKSEKIIEVRSVLHEFPATIAFLTIILFLFQTTLHKEILLVAAICVPTHFILDFLTGHTRPLRPFSKKPFFLGWYNTPKQGMIFESVTTIVFLIIYFVFV